MLQASFKRTPVFFIEEQAVVKWLAVLWQLLAEALVNGSTEVRLVFILAIAIVSAKPGTGQNAPPAEAFRVLPVAEAEGPQITPYLLYQTNLAWDEDELRLQRWSHVKSENELLELRA